MLKLLKSSAAVIACVLLGTLAVSGLHAADSSSSAKGTIKGVVYDADHKPVANANVRLMAPGDVGHKPAAAAPATQPGDSSAPKARPAPLASTTTDAQGTYTFPDVAVGDYAVTAGVKGTGHGMEKVTVTAGATATCDITLKAHAKKPV